MGTNLIIDTLKALKTVCFDGNLPSKNARDWLFTRGYVQRGHGYNWLTVEGVGLCKTLMLLGDE